MSTIKLTCFDSETFRSNRTAEIGSSNMRERHKKLSSSYQCRRATLSPLQLAHKTLDNLEFKGLSIGLMRLESRGSPLPQEKPLKTCPSPPEELSFLSKHYNFTEHRRLYSRFDSANIKKKVNRDKQSTEKYTVLAKNKRFVGKSPIRSIVVKGLLPATKARTRSHFNEREIRLRINGVMKCFSPRGSSNALDPVLQTFKK